MCGCGQMTKGGRFLPGHDSRLKSRLIQDARAGDTDVKAGAVERLKELGWWKEGMDLVPVKVSKPRRKRGDGRCPPLRRKEPSTATAEIPPSVMIFRECVGRYPIKTWWPFLDTLVGQDQRNLDRWREVVFRYVGCGWNPQNLNNMTRFFINGELPGDGYGETAGKDNGRQKKREVVTV